jgi:hypothetical protein
MEARFNTVVIYFRILTLENVGTAVNYSSIFITLAFVVKASLILL